MVGTTLTFSYWLNVQSNNFYAGTQWHLTNGIPMSKVCATHYSEIGVNCFAGLKAWGIEYVPIEVVPGTVEFGTPPAPWLVGGPYRLYEPPQLGQVSWPTYYADWLSVPGHPEFDGQFFNIYSELRDVAPCGDWCPNNDVEGSISRATKMAKRSLDSVPLVMLDAFNPPRPEPSPAKRLFAFVNSTVLEYPPASCPAGKVPEEIWLALRFVSPPPSPANPPANRFEAFANSTTFG